MADADGAAGPAARRPVRRVDETELQLEAALRAREEALAAKVDDPFDRRPGFDGVMIDMRPPLFKIKVAEREYAHLLENGLLVEAVHALVTRLALTRMHFGEVSERTVMAQLTVAKAYVELRNLPRQSLKHAEHAKTVLRQCKEARIVPATRLALLESSALVAVATAQVAVAALPDSAAAKRRASQKTKAKATGAAAVPDSTARRATAPPRAGPAARLTAADKLLDKARRNLDKARAAVSGHPPGDTTAEVRLRIQVAAAALHRQLGEHPAAAAALHAALTALEAAPPPVPDAEGMATELRRSLAEVEAARGSHDAAVDALAKTMAAAEAAHGAQAPELAAPLVAMARALMKAGDDGAAESHLQRAVDLLTAALRTPPSELARTLVCGLNDTEVPFLGEWLEAVDQMVKLQIRQGQFREAVAALKMVTPIKAELNGPRSAAVAAAEYLHGNVLLALEKPEAAIKRIAKARELWAAGFGAKHRKVTEADRLLAAVRKEGGRSTLRKGVWRHPSKTIPGRTRTNDP